MVFFSGMLNLLEGLAKRRDVAAGLIIHYEAPKWAESCTPDPDFGNCPLLRRPLSYLDMSRTLTY